MNVLKMTNTTNLRSKMCMKGSSEQGEALDKRLKSITLANAV